MEAAVDLDISHDSAPTTSSQVARKIKWILYRFSLLSYTSGFLLAAIFSLGIGGFCCYLIWLDFMSGAKFTISGWAQSIITFLLGAWVTHRPKFLKRNKKQKD